MEVILKKSKVTSPILNQTLSYVSLDNFKDCEPLGWVVHGKEKWVVFYKDSVLRKVLYNYSISCQDDWEQVASENGGWDRLKVYYIVIQRPQRNDIREKFTVKYEALNYIEEYNNVMQKAKDKGQFYI